jgi:hypothetical protein
MSPPGCILVRRPAASNRFVARPDVPQQRSYIIRASRSLTRQVRYACNCLHRSRACRRSSPRPSATLQWRTPARSRERIFLCMRAITTPHARPSPCCPGKRRRRATALVSCRLLFRKRSPISWSPAQVSLPSLCGVLVRQPYGFGLVSLAAAGAIPKVSARNRCSIDAFRDRPADLKALAVWDACPHAWAHNGAQPPFPDGETSPACWLAGEWGHSPYTASVLLCAKRDDRNLSVTAPSPAVR